MFERSVSGQQNRAAFLNVDFTCYVEGGNQSGDAPDITFWRETLKALRPDLVIGFLPRGGKPILEQLANDIVANNVKNVLVAMDSDYDDLVGDKIVSPNVLYTFGYSWENDLYALGMMHLIFMNLCHCDLIPQPIHEHINKAVENFSSNIKWPIRADYLAFRAGSSLMPRSSPGRVIGFDLATSLIIIKRSEILKILQSCSIERRPPASSNASNLQTPRHCIGHVFAHAMCSLLRGLVKKHRGGAQPSSDHIRDVAFQIFGRFVGDDDGPIGSHYRSMCAAF